MLVSLEALAASIGICDAGKVMLQFHCKLEIHGTLEVYVLKDNLKIELGSQNEFFEDDKEARRCQFSHHGLFKLTMPTVSTQSIVIRLA